jgi:hypothetical protein
MEDRLYHQQNDILKKIDGFMSQVNGIDPREKWKSQLKMKKCKVCETYSKCQLYENNTCPES